MSQRHTDIRGRNTLQRCWRRVDFKVGIAILASLALIAILGPRVVPYPEEGEGIVTDAARLRGPQPPSMKYLFGTDVVGRDMLSRVFIGSRYSLLQTTIVVFGSLLLGIVLGVLAGYLRGIYEAAINYAIELFILLPPVMIAAALSVVIGPSIYTVVASLIMTWWAWYARIAYIMSRQIREFDFVKVSEALGSRRIYVAFRHILPNVAPTVIMQSIVDSSSILLEVAAINFLIGSVSTSLDAPEWGMMIGYGFRYVTTYWWMSLFPGFFLVIAALGFILIGDSVSEESSPNLRKRWTRWF
ncbi:MAG: ABC transporter permease [Sulfolobales archaeon]|nr:ABC transporter permease [Sulfolobales archaeon]MDW8083464.1 ABC transporter permease [Sulfolobales archaeon]